MATITDVPGILVGHATDFKAITGCTVILCPQGAVGACDIRGGASGTREIDPLSPFHLVPKIHAILLSGGSAFGLDAASGVMAWLKEKKIGFSIENFHVPIVPTAILFDLWLSQGKKYPDFAMGYQACQNASQSRAEEGSVGAGTGATVGKLLGIRHAMKGGIGSAFITLSHGAKVGALCVVNAWGDVLEPFSGKILAGTRTSPSSLKLADSTKLLLQRKQKHKLIGGNTTLVVVATDAGLNKAEAQRMAVMAQDGLARTLSPVHSAFDGDLVFVLSTGKRKVDLNALGTASAFVVAESILRGVKKAKSLAGIPSYSDFRVKKVGSR
jgi:L-aminopeptidase/D-esterase-like protein